MNKVILTIPTNVHHVAQIVTGFLMLREQGMDVEIINDTRNGDNPMNGYPVIKACLCGGQMTTIVYDTWDGYQAPSAIKACVEECDFYFRRSYCRERNVTLFPEYADKMYPLGFNYYVTYSGNPVREPIWKSFLKPFLGRAPDAYFTPDVFEGSAEQKSNEAAKILFLTRLWDDQEEGFSPEDLAERTYINTMRIEIIQGLRERYGERFVGGLNDCELSRKWAPNLIVPREYTERRKYLKLLHSSDICIGSMGLFESIGWKTGEYVAAAKAIVNERFHYQVPGDFAEGTHYLAFSTAGECLDAVQSLMEDPKRMYQMKLANQKYYREFLRPDVMVKNTLDIVEKEMKKDF